MLCSMPYRGGKGGRRKSGSLRFWSSNGDRRAEPLPSIVRVYVGRDGLGDANRAVLTAAWNNVSSAWAIPVIK